MHCYTRRVSVIVSGIDSISTATSYSVPIINSATLPVECRNLALSPHQTKKTHLRNRASTEADYPAARHGDINLSPPHEDAVGVSYGMRLICLPDLPDY